MEATLKFNLPEENAEFELAVNGSKMYSVLWDTDQWLRAQYKYMSDEEYSEDKYEAYENARNRLRDIMFEHGINLNL